MSKKCVVAIDGPAGAGKSTVARRLAERLGFVLLDTGAIYRTVALAAKRADVAWSDHDGVTAVAKGIAERDELRFVPDPAADASSRGLKVLLCGDDVSRAIREPDISMGASTCSAIAGVRAALLELQRKLGSASGVVAEGRDTTTVVFPDADHKFFLIASSRERARRRAEQLGEPERLDEIMAAMDARDHLDATRANSPLVQAPDAILIDTDGLDAERVLTTLLGYIVPGDAPSDTRSDEGPA